LDCYHIWFNLRNSREDLAFARDLRRYMDLLRERGAIESYRLTRRKLGFGPPSLGEFHVCIETRDLAQLEEAFQAAAARSGEVEEAHRAVYSAVTDFSSALYRDFPDPVRAGPDGAPG